MKKQLSIIGIFTFFLFVNLSCNRTSKEVAKSGAQTPSSKVTPLKPIEKTAVFEDFDQFYTKFHIDTVFQISRIKFPLKGHAMDTSEIPVEWKKNNWIMHKSNIYDIDTTLFNVEILSEPNNYAEKIYIEGGGFANERIFKRINGKWYLVSYIDEDL